MEGHDNVYAIGDICDTPDPRLAYVAGEQAKLLAQNLAKNANSKAMKAWIPSEYYFNILGRLRNFLCHFVMFSWPNQIQIQELHLCVPFKDVWL